MRFDPDKWAKTHPFSPIKQNVPLAGLTTLGVGGKAPYLAKVFDEDDLLDVLELCQAGNLPVFVLGGGSNTLFEDHGFRGLVLTLGEGFKGVFVAGRKIIAGAGATARSIVSLAQKFGLSGLEPLVGLPGTLGGAIRQNAGGRLGSIGELVDRIRVLGADGVTRDIFRPALDFTYRNLDLGPFGGIVLEVELALTREDPLEILRKTEDCLTLRSNQPKGKSLGCVFQNPLTPPAGGSELDDVSGEKREREILSAGQLIDICGFRGRRIGGAKVSEEHANFILNVGGATAADFMALVEAIQQEVFQRFGLSLKLEISRPRAGDRFYG
ncbi:MAG: UDP-N-acetylmuramate dehydrogenase [Deltaproteobacteria bacterium]|jgi:UDP-N-acetylmuramate dehydrogenase|nr:UDP-N-acetylmuramate dehydrogenase [Deltaproteobacteria bacterium]